MAGCELSQPGVVCVECVGAQGYGWLNGSECVYETFVLQTLDRVVPVSDCGLRKCNQGGTCVPAAMGARCAECSYRGYTALSGEDLTPVCVCYDARYDPKAGCKSLYDDVLTEVEVTDAYESVVCEPWSNKYLGFYEQDTTPFKYGNANPPTPKKCKWPYGPPPFALVENLPPFQSCATLGGADPNEAFGIRKDFSFQTCSGHGTWNVEDHSCTCDAPSWQRALTGEYDVYGGAVMTCDDCADNYGPPPPHHDPLQTPQLPPYCSKIWMEDFDGVRKECSGHGTYSFGICICDSSTTTGFWNTTKIDGVSTCLVCADGYGPERDCRLFDGQTSSPAVDTAEPTSAPTPPPFRSSSCVSCFDRFKGQGTLVGNAWEFAAVPSSIQSVCGVCNVTTDGEYVYVSDTACTNTTVALAALGYEMCDYVSGCVAFDFTLRENGTAYAYHFANTTGYQAVPDIDANAAWSLACGKTNSPTRNPTSYPTQYPTMAPVPVPTTLGPTGEPTTLQPTTLQPTSVPTTVRPTTMGPTTLQPTLSSKPTRAPTLLPIRAPTRTPTGAPTTLSPTTLGPSTLNPTATPTTLQPTIAPTTPQPTTVQPTIAPTTPGPTAVPTTRTPTTHTPTTNTPTTQPTSQSPTTRPTLPAR